MPAVSPLNVVVVPVPVCVAPPGEAVTVHVPAAGSPLRSTDPVATAHVGWVTSAVGADGVAGCPFTVAVAAAEVQLAAPAVR